MPTLLFIIAANLASTGASLTLAAMLSFRWLSGLVDRMVHVSIGLLLATALVHIIPDALAAGLSPGRLGWSVLLGILGLFVLEKMTLVHHTHPHESEGHEHPAQVDTRELGRGGYPILIADALHNFADGVVIAASFLVDARAGLLTALAVVAHEIPHEIGDFMILLNAGFSRRRSFLFMLLSGGSAVLGGVVGYFVLARAQALLPYALAIAAASFIYIALSDLLPELMRRSSLRKSLPEVGFVFLGVAVAIAAMGLEP
ncbi:MAG TPA: ZIP family metal transporter [Burkholderiaceae bacterium]|nr:ZIP family metal transporter [Burkholderiaceae bacterium]